MTCTGPENGELVDGHIVAWSGGSQLRVRLQDGREIQAIPELEALKAAECPGALIYNRPAMLPKIWLRCGTLLSIFCGKSIHTE
jgi:hypothetical protein